MMTFILLGDMFGLGTLTLPADFARLGWMVTVAMMVLCLAGVLYSGRVFTLLAAWVKLSPSSHLPPCSPTIHPPTPMSHASLAVCLRP